jgi:uncharacterized protein with HEPN domain
MARDPQPALIDMLEAIEGIERVTGGKAFDDFEGDWLLRRAVERAVEIISEASRRLPADIRALRPEIPRRDVATIGNVLRHEYQSTSTRIIWHVVKDDLPPLKAAVEAMAKELR